MLTIDSGDTVHFRTLEVGWSIASPATPNEQGQKFEPRNSERDNGHALCGPIALRGAKPGMTLEIRINDIRPGTWGWTVGGGRATPINTRMGVAEQREMLLWTLDTKAMTGRDQYGHTVKLHPFMGIMGMPPDEPGIHSTIPPRFCGGNIDCKELVAGSSLYLPIVVNDALFSTGDGHGVQGDGELSGVALECPMERVDLTFYLREDMHSATPRANTPAGWVTLGFHEDLHEASLIALEAMLDLMGEQYGMPRTQALALASLVVDLRITQLVNGGMLGVHAVLPHDALQKPTNGKE
ncbi:MAG: acetamidase/formamidase family protein [Ktedonobacteraceae bacterium]